MINEMCDESLKGSANINVFPRITMLSRLWMLHAYEVIRSLDEFDRHREDSTGGKLAKFNTNRFFDLKKDLGKIRIPMVKQLKPNENGKDKESSYFTIRNAGKKNVSFIVGEVEITREAMVKKVFDVVNNYERNKL